MRGAVVGPLTEIGLAEDDRAGFAQATGDKGIPQGNGTLQSQRARGSRHAVGSIDVVLDKHRNAVERATGPFRLALLIQRAGNGERIRVGLDHAVQRWTLVIDLRNAGQIFFRQRTCRIATGTHVSLQVGNSEFIQFKVALPGAGHG